MKSVRFDPGRPSLDLEGSVLARDVSVGERRWSKGRRLSADDLRLLCDPSVVIDSGPRGREPGARPGFTVLVIEAGDVHEDEAALRLARAVAGPGLTLRGPNESRVDLLAEAAGVIHVDVGRLERLNRIDPLEAFTLFDGQAVSAGEVVASVKIAPHVVAEAVLARGIAVAARPRGLVSVAPFIPRRVAVVVKESIRPVARERFEASIRTRVEALGSTLLGFHYVADEPEAVVHALRRFAAGRSRADVILTAGAASTDPTDAFFDAITRLGGSVVRHGVPAHPGSMVWLARIGRTDVLGLPTCGAYSKATAADLILPRLLTGERASARMVARLGHGGVLVRAMRFRFPPYAQDLEAPEG